MLQNEFVFWFQRSQRLQRKTLWGSFKDIFLINANLQREGEVEEIQCRLQMLHAAIRAQGGHTWISLDVKAAVWKPQEDPASQVLRVEVVELREDGGSEDEKGEEKGDDGKQEKGEEEKSDSDDVDGRQQ